MMLPAETMTMAVGELPVTMAVHNEQTAAAMELGDDDEHQLLLLPPIKKNPYYNLIPDYPE